MKKCENWVWFIIHGNWIFKCPFWGLKFRKYYTIGFKIVVWISVELEQCYLLLKSMLIMLKTPAMLVSFCIMRLHYCYRFKEEGNTLLLRPRRQDFETYCYVIKSVCLPWGFSHSIWIHSLKFWIPSLFENNT